MMELYKQNYQKELISICHERLPFEQLKNKSILITGITGMIGSYLLDTFIKLNEIHGLRMEITGNYRNIKKAQGRVCYYKEWSDVRFLIGDITENIFEDHSWDYIIHCAGNNQPCLFGAEPVDTIKTAFIGTLNLLEKCKKRFVLLSSGEVYGSQMCPVENGFSETDAGMVKTMEPRSCYPEGKRAAETLCAAYYQQYGTEAVVARLSYIYGHTVPLDSSKADAQFIKNAVSHNNILMKSKGHQFRSYTYISDAVTGILYVLLKGEAGEAYNVANPNCKATIREFAEQLATAARVKVEFIDSDNTEKQGYSTMQKEILNPEKLYRLGFEAKVSLEDGMQNVMGIMTEEEG